MDTYKQEYTTLGIAAAGVYATIGSNCRVSIPDSRLDAYLGELVEGGTVIDKRPCLNHEKFVQTVISGPMLKEDLPFSSCNKAFEREILPCSMEEVANLGGYDYLSLDLYVKLWQQMGARIGKRVGNTIRWDDSEVQQIPSEDSRWKVSR